MTGNLFPARLRISHQDKHQNSNYRRNGRLQACEPCRRGKLRCDHMLPTCGRCSRRAKPEQCVYHPAPLTKISKTSSLRANSFSSLHYAPSKQSTQHTLTDLAATSSYPPNSPIQSVEPVSVCVLTSGALIDSNDDPSKARISRTSSIQAEPWSPSPQSIEELQKPLPDFDARADVLTFDDGSAFINNSAVVSENEVSIGITPPNPDSTHGSEVLQSHIDRGATVLALLKDLPSLQKYIDKWFAFAGGIVVIAPMMQILTTEIWSTWQKALVSQKPAELRRMSKTIWVNTLQPVSRLLHRHTTTRQFCVNVTGPFLRWEVVGIVMTLVSLLAQSLKDGDQILCSHDEAPVDRAALALRMLNASEMCVGFCDDFGVLNDLYVWLLHANSIAYCSMRTRGSYENSRKTSSLIAAVLSCNLHQPIKVDDHTPFFIAELRKRLFICVYDNDKDVATSTGRPPRLTRQYCRLQIPLDLTDAQLMSDGTDLEIAVEALDGDGWNQCGTVQRCTFARLSATKALITEEILEISLGLLQQDKVVRRAAEIEAKTNRYWEELPGFLRIDIDEAWDTQRAPLELLFLMLIRLGHLAHRFLLQRTLIKKVGIASANSNISLLSVSSEIFKCVVKMINSKDLFRDFQVDFVSVLTAHGIPSAAVIAVELLRQNQSPASTSAIAYPLHRSDTIQNLSIFVSCLGTVRKEANGFQSCDRGRKFLKKILDTILGPGPASPSTGRASLEEIDDSMFGAPLLQASSDGDFVKWFEDMEWDQDGLVNFN